MSDPGRLSRREFLGAMAVTVLTAGYAGGAPGDQPTTRISPHDRSGNNPLADGWTMQSSSLVSESGQAISRLGYAATKWYAVTLPSTVLAALVAHGEYPDIFVGDNLSRVPADRFADSWWYRREFDLLDIAAGRKFWLDLKGINYRANVWLNGKQIGTSDQIVGTYRDFEIDITAAADVKNALAIEVFPPKPKRDLTITFVDWAPAPPDQNMGIWQDACVRTSGPAAMRYPYVQTDLELPAMASARLTVMVDLINGTDKPVTGTLEGRIESLRFSQDVTLQAGQTQTFDFSPDQFAQLVVNHPRVWWPWQFGSQEMYDLNLTFSIAGDVSDRVSTRFGIRKVTSRLAKKHRLFSVNGVDLLVLGGGYAPDLLQRRDMQEAHIRYARDMNLNTIRLEGKLEDDAFYDLCDQYGMLVMAGWCCCSPWERSSRWKAEQQLVAAESLRYQIRRARTHPSMLVWLNGSDNPPPAPLEKQYLGIEADLKWPSPILSSAGGEKTSLSEATGVKMEGPYQWEPPIFWMKDKSTGGAFGFNTEVGPGPVPPPLESLQKMLPPEHRWPIDAIWNFHCGRESFGNVDTFKHALDARFGPSQGIADFSWKAQAQAYETIRAMYEAFRRNKFDATGEIQWMLNNAWPSMIWHLYDYYLRPGAAYFATKLACRPVHVLYSYDNHWIVVANDSLQPAENISVTAQVYNIDGSLKQTHSQTLTSPANKSVKAFPLPPVADFSTTYFLRLTLRGPDQQVMDVNSYWLSTKPDVLGQNDGDESWNMTPCVSFADYTLLETLPKVNLTLDGFAVRQDGHDDIATVKVTNTSAAVAMMVRLKISKGSPGDEVLPIRWEDNYFMLLPGESRQIEARYLTADLQGANPVITVDCFNNGRGV